MLIEFDLTNASDELRQIARDRMAELEQQATYLTKVLGREVTVEDVIEMEKEED